MRQRYRRLVTIGACLLWTALPGASPVHAQADPGTTGTTGGIEAAPRSGTHAAAMAARFADANTTHDGRLTLAQARQGGLRGVAKNFDVIDADHKGFVTLADIRAFHHARKAAQRQAAQRQAPPSGQTSNESAS